MTDEQPMSFEELRDYTLDGLRQEKILVDEMLSVIKEKFHDNPVAIFIFENMYDRKMKSVDECIQQLEATL